MAKKPKQKLRKVDFLPLDRNRVYLDRAIMGRSLTGILPVEEGSFLVYTVDDDGKRKIQIKFDKTKLDTMENASDDIKIHLGQRTLWLYRAAKFFSLRNNTGCDGKFTLSELRKLYNTSKSGQFTENIKQSIRSLRTLSVDIVERNGDFISFNYFSFVQWQTIGSENVIRYRFNEDTLGPESEYLKIDGNLKDTTMFKNGYIPMKIEEFEDTGEDPNYIAFRERIRGIKPAKDGLNRVGIALILNEWLALSKDKLRRKTYCENLVLGYFKRARDEGEITGLGKTYDSEIKNWQERTFFTFGLPASRLYEAEVYQLPF